MAAILSYKGKVNFESYTLLDDTNDTFEDDSVSLEGYDVANVYVCPCCVKKYNLYDELDTSEAKNDVQIEMMQDEDMFDTPAEDFVCCVDGCENRFADECILPLDHCYIIRIDKEYYINEFAQKLEECRELAKADAEPDKDISDFLEDGTLVYDEYGKNITLEQQIGLQLYYNDDIALKQWVEEILPKYDNLDAPCDVESLVKGLNELEEVRRIDNALRVLAAHGEIREYEKPAPKKVKADIERD